MAMALCDCGGVLKHVPPADFLNPPQDDGKQTVQCDRCKNVARLTFWEVLASVRSGGTPKGESK